MMTSAKVVEMSVTTTDSVSPSLDYCHPDDQTIRSNVIPSPPSHPPPFFDTVHDDFFLYPISFSESYKPPIWFHL